MRNNLKYLLFIVVAALLVNTSCNKKLDESYQNPNAAVVEPVEQLLPSMIGAMIGNGSGAANSFGIAGDILLTGRYIQYWGTYSTTFSPISTTAADQSNYDEMGGTVGASASLGNVWGMYYFAQGQSINRIIDWGSQQQKWDFVGAAWALRAWGMLEATNEYSDIILTEAFDQSRQQFDYNPQSQTYDSVRATCFRALSYLNMTGGSMNPTNFAASDYYLNGGSLDKWKKFVYGVLARSYAYISNKSTYSPDSVIKYASLSCATNADNIVATFAAIGSSGTSNYFGPFRGNVGSLRQSQYIADLMSGANTGAFTGVTDPRAWYILKEDSNSTFKGITPWLGSSGLGTRDQPYNFWGNPYSSTGAPATAKGRYLFRDNAPFPLMTASEMQFLIAEAYLRKSNNASALTAYTNGISLNIDMLTNNYSLNVPAPALITPAMKSAFLSNTAIVPASPVGLTLSMVMLQKYIALYGWGVQETWCDMRRYHYTDVDRVTNSGSQVYVNFTPPSGTNLFTQNNGKLVYRCRPNYNSEYLYNIPALTAIGAYPVGNDYHTKECWFSQP